MDAPVPTPTEPSVRNIPSLPIVKVEPAAMSKPVEKALSLPPTGASGPAKAFAESCSSLSTPFHTRTSSNLDLMSKVPHWQRPSDSLKSDAWASVHEAIVTTLSLSRKPVMASRDIARTVVDPSPFVLNVIEMCCGRFGNSGSMPTLSPPWHARYSPPINMYIGAYCDPVFPPYSWLNPYAVATENWLSSSLAYPKA